MIGEKRKSIKRMYKNAMRLNLVFYEKDKLLSMKQVILEMNKNICMLERQNQPERGIKKQHILCDTGYELEIREKTIIISLVIILCV